MHWASNLHVVSSLEYQNNLRRGALQTHFPHFADGENEMQEFDSGPFTRTERGRIGSQMCVT